MKPTRIYYSMRNGDVSGEILELRSMSMSGPRYDVADVTNPMGYSYRFLVNTILDYGTLLLEVGSGGLSAALFLAAGKVLWTVESDKFDIDFDGYVTEISQSCDSAQIKVKIVGPVKYYYEAGATTAAPQLFTFVKDVLSKKFGKVSANIHASTLAKVLEQARESVTDQIRFAAAKRTLDNLGRTDEEIRCDEEAEDYRYDD